MIELTCLWAICSVSNQQLIGCGQLGSGKPEDMARASYMADKSGQLFMSECSKDGKFEIDWKGKQGLFFKKGK